MPTESNDQKPPSDFSPLPPDPEIAAWVQQIPAIITAEAYTAVTGAICAKYGNNDELLEQKLCAFNEALGWRELSSPVFYERLEGGLARPTHAIQPVLPDRPPIEHCEPAPRFEDLPADTREAYRREAEQVLAVSRKNKKFQQSLVGRTLKRFGLTLNPYRLG